MGESRLEKGLRAVAWALLAATVAALLAVGLWVQASAATPPDGDMNDVGAADSRPSEEAR